MSNPQASSSYNDQGNEQFPIPPPMAPNRFTIPMEPKLAPIHLHLTMILKKLFNHPAPIPSFNDGLVASNLLSPLQMIYKGVCKIQDQLHVTQTNVSWLREVFPSLFAIVLTFDIQVQQKNSDLIEAYTKREISLVHELEYTRSKLYGKFSFVL